MPHCFAVEAALASTYVHEHIHTRTCTQVPASALDSLVSAEVMLANAQARMAAMQQEAAAAAPKAAKPRLKSVVVASEAYDPRCAHGVVYF